MKHRTRLPLPTRAPGGVQLWLNTHFGAEYRFDGEPQATERATWLQVGYTIATVVLCVVAAILWGQWP